MIAGGENQSIEHTINQISKRTGKDQSHTNYEAAMIFFSNDIFDIKYSEYYCEQSEDRERHLTPFAAKFPSPGHALIFDKEETKPVWCDRDLLSVKHMCFYPEFQGLISNNDSGNN